MRFILLNNNPLNHDWGCGSVVERPLCMVRGMVMCGRPGFRSSAPPPFCAFWHFFVLEWFISCMLWLCSSKTCSSNSWFVSYKGCDSCDIYCCFGYLKVQNSNLEERMIEVPKKKEKKNSVLEINFWCSIGSSNACDDLIPAKWVPEFIGSWFTRVAICCCFGQKSFSESAGIILEQPWFLICCRVTHVDPTMMFRLLSSPAFCLVACLLLVQSLCGIASASLGDRLPDFRQCVSVRDWPLMQDGKRCWRPVDLCGRELQVWKLCVA